MKRCKYCRRKVWHEAVDLCGPCNDAFNDGEEQGIKHAQYVMRTALGLEGG